MDPTGQPRAAVRLSWWEVEALGKQLALESRVLRANLWSQARGVAGKLAMSPCFIQLYWLLLGAVACFLPRLVLQESLTSSLGTDSLI